MKIINDLSRVLTDTLPYFQLDDEKYHRSYGPDKWTIKELLVHIADAETVMYDRLRRIIAGPKQVILAFDQNGWCTNLKYQQYPLHLAQAQYEATRANVIHLADCFYESLGSKEWIHSETGLRTLKDEFDKIVWHNRHHLDQILRAMKG